MGTVPKEIGNLRKLEVLDIYGNNFSGTVPSQIKPLQMWSDCRVGSNGKAEIKCESCTHCCHDKANPKCIARKTNTSSSSSGGSSSSNTKKKKKKKSSF